MDALAGWWVVVESERFPDCFIGPYDSEAAAVLAMNEDPLIEELVSDDCIECSVQQGSVPPRDAQIYRLPQETDSTSATTSPDKE